MSQKATGSAYFLEERTDPYVSHTLSILVDNEPGVLSRIAGLFSGRGVPVPSRGKGAQERFAPRRHL